MSGPAASAASKVAAAGLVVEVLRSIAWIGRILSVATVYDAPVFMMVGLRAAVTALQMAAGIRLWQGAANGRSLAWPAYGASALLLGGELGLGLAPSSVPPGLEWPFIAAYACYAAIALTILRVTDPDK